MGGVPERAVFSHFPLTENGARPIMADLLICRLDCRLWPTGKMADLLIASFSAKYHFFELKSDKKMEVSDNEDREVPLPTIKEEYFMSYAMLFQFVNFRVEYCNIINYS